MGEIIELRPRKTATVELTFEEVVNLRVSILTRLEKLTPLRNEEHGKKKISELLVLMKKLYTLREELGPGDVSDPGPT